MSQRVLVTAGGSGIGRAIAETFLRAGDRVHVCDIDGSMLQELSSDFPEASVSVTDVGESGQVDAMFAAVEYRMGGLDVLINNAGIGGQRALIEDIDLDQWQQSLQVNLTGPFLTMRRAIPAMKAQSSGCIINIVTTSAITGLPNRTCYVASKCGLRGLTQNAARELGPFNIRVNGVFPGAIDNERGRGIIAKFAAEKDLSIDEATEKFLSFVSMRTLIEPQEIADMCAFLASPAARHVSGQEICVDGNVEWEE
ncbi:MAG: SDR family oxidoreductase [Pseudomonadota bacterium]